MDLHNKTAIVTGASGGLGAAISETLIQNGTKVYGLARNTQALHTLQKRLGAQFIPVPLDISNYEAVKSWVSETFSENNGPDILINNAGAGSFGKIDEMPTEEWAAMINTNLNGLYYITSQVASLLKKKKEGSHIINIGSILGSMGRAEGAAYCATKYGVQGFTDALFKELRFFNIKVTCFNPGSIDTHFFESSGIAAHTNMLQPHDLANTVVHLLQTPDNMLISDITIRPLNPKDPEK
ncbi:SDR family oxidoreductase [Gelidibacter gilvus]|uniref:SDR family NAD(P)-dependent oxidoreductase n=1 Tax=Gelidibacter gilvus TaxID=59602 RepID=A0A4Q0XFY1_9FLAO|nr:SDR family NAD(P)-dependent oxidoreductase [Gelidibacter gilvus]RXJ49962.1 SDR family NAD(P)-dependent oxidoreductase [Gelidibacter gilvus]